MHVIGRSDASSTVHFTAAPFPQDSNFRGTVTPSAPDIMSVKWIDSCTVVVQLGVSHVKYRAAVYGIDEGTNFVGAGGLRLRDVCVIKEVLWISPLRCEICGGELFASLGTCVICLLQISSLLVCSAT